MRLKCPLCPDKSFHNRHGLNIHTIRMHKNQTNGALETEEPKPDSEPETATCQFCGKVVNKSGIGSHVKWCKKLPADAPTKRNSKGGAPAELCYCPRCGLNLVTVAAALSVAAGLKEVGRG